MMTRLVVSQVPFEIKKLLQLLLSNLQSVIWVPGTSVYYDELDPCTYLFKLNDLSIACCTANSCKKEECARDISSNDSSTTPRIQSCKIPSHHVGLSLEEKNSLVLCCKCLLHMTILKQFYRFTSFIAQNPILKLLKIVSVLK